MTPALRFPLRAAALGAALLCGAAQAQQAWVLTTDETNATYRNNLFAAVENTYGAGNVIDGRTALNSNTPLGALPPDVNLVVIGMLGTNTTGLNAARWAEVQSLIAAPGRELTVAWFIDGALSARHANSGELLNLLNDQLGYTGTADAMSAVQHSTGATGGGAFHRNPTTGLSAGLPTPLSGGVYTAFRNVFGQYTIYLEGAAGNPAPVIPATNTEKTTPGAYGLMLPRAALQNQQTCVFAFGDISPFSSAGGPSNAVNTLMAGIGAAAGTGGLCTSTAVPHPDLVPTVTAPSGLVTGATGTVAVDVRNQGLVDSADGSLAISLPAGLEIDPAGTLPAGCTATSSTTVSCTLSAIAAGASTSLSLPVLATAPIATAQPITATVQSVTGELAPQQGNNTHSAPVTVGTAPVVPVTVVDLVPSVVTVPSLNVGQSGAVVLRVSNNGTAASTNGVLVIDLPAGLQVPATASLPAGCTRTSATQVSCTLGALAAGGGFSDFSIPVQALSATAAGAQLSAAISGVAGEPAANQGNNATTAPIAVGQLAAVPTLDAWGLGALAAALGALGLRRQRRRAQAKPAA